MSDEVERFRPTSGRLIGGLALVMSGVVVVIALVVRDSGVAPWGIAAACFTGALSWTAMLRPAVSLAEHELVMRNMLDTVHVPLAAVEDVVVRQVLAVKAGERRFLSPAIGRTRRQINRNVRVPGEKSSGRKLAEEPYALFVEERIRGRAADAREKAGIKAHSEEQRALAADVRRERAWPEIAALTLSAVALVVTLLL